MSAALALMLPACAGGERRAATPSAPRPIPPGAAPGAPAILEKRTNKVTLCAEETSQPGDFWRAVSPGCGSWMCKKCKTRRGYDLRKRLQGKAHLFAEPRLYTITVNREWHESPEAAYVDVTQAKFLARLLTKELGVRRWVWVLEPQAESGDGWPHWHILMDVSDLPGKWYSRELKEAREEEPEDKKGWQFIPHFFDLNRVHRLLRKWKVGEQCRLTVKKEDFASAAHAINYITKYLVKMPERGYPSWMLKRPGIRFVQASRALGPVVSGARREKGQEGGKEAKPRLRKANRQPVKRIAECGTRVAFIQYDGRRDRQVIAGPFKALKNTVVASPGAVIVPDFDFETKREFPTVGFASIIDVWRFESIWKTPELQQELAAGIAARETALLGAWASAGDG